MYFDLEYKARTDGEFQHGLRQRIDRVGVAEQLKDRRGKLEPFQNAVRDLISYCNWNMSFLAPFYWPRFQGGGPLSFSDYPFAVQMFNLQIGGFTVIRGSRQIGKSTSFCVRQMLNTRVFNGFRTMYIVPRIQQLNTYATRMREMEKCSRLNPPKSDFRNNLTLKEMPNSSSMEMVYVLTNASPVRGKTADELLFDEIQDFDPDLEIEVSQIQSASKMPITIYAGTSLTTDTMLESKWSESSQGVWVTKCNGCNHDNIPLPEHNVLDMIQPRGPSCVKCGKLLSVSSGRFIHQSDRMYQLGYRGFHIPQIIVPDVVYNEIRWAKIYRMKERQGGDRKFFQEVLGIATETGEREITRTDLMNMCTLGHPNVVIKKAKDRKYTKVVSGCDWGGSDYIPSLKIKKSTTVHVALGINPDSTLDIIHFRRYSGMNYDDIVGDIMHMHKTLNGYAIASDFGVGAAYNSRIRELTAPFRHLIFNYSGPTTALIARPKDQHLFNQWSLNKTESITLTFDAIRSGRFKCFNWDIAEEYLVDFLNLFRAPADRENAAGNVGSTFLYRGHPTKPNDALMAVNYAFMLAKILIGEPMFADQSMKILMHSTLAGQLSGQAMMGIRQMPSAFSG